MGGGGPSKDVKRANAAKDRSHLVVESWERIGRNVAAIVLITCCVWVFCGAMRWLCEIGDERLFEPFGEEGGAGGPWTLLAVLIGGGILRGILFRFPFWKDSEGDGVAAAITEFHATYEPAAAAAPPGSPFLAALRRVVMTALTVGTGGSGGLEAPVLPLGERLAAWIGGILGVRDPDDIRVFTMAGISAAVASLLNAPFTAALFTAEVLFTDRILYRPLLYSLLAAVLAYALNNHFLAFEPLFIIKAHSFKYSLAEYLQVALVAVLISAPAGIGVAALFHRLKNAIQRVPGLYRPGLGAAGAGAVALALWFGLGVEPRHVLGVGEETLKQLLHGNGQAELGVWWILVLIVCAKALATGLTLMAGGSAGLLVPAMFLGGTMGAAAHLVLAELGLPAGPNANLFIVAGIASALVGVIEVPLAAIAFVTEVFGAHFAPPAIVACVVCHMLAKRLKLYVDG
jgi:CIC family chloride channel protein